MAARSEIGAGGRAREDEVEEEVDLRLKGLIGLLLEEDGIGSGTDCWFEIDNRFRASVRSSESPAFGTDGSPAPPRVRSRLDRPLSLIVRCL